MPNTSELTQSINTMIFNEEWQTTTFFISNKEAGGSKNIIFTPLLAAYYLSQCSCNDQAKMLANQLVLRLQPKSESLQWNYLLGQQQYPNDLDSTIIASSVLLQSKQHQKSDVISAIVKNLIAVEEKPGGPYRTWFVEKNDTRWGKDIDLVINYRVHTFLQQLNIRLDTLAQWLQNNASSHKQSAYYSSFESAIIRAAITDSWEWKKLIPGNPYEAAILLIISLNQHKQKYLTELYEYYRLLIELPIEKITAHPVFVNRVKDNTAQWAGSLMLTHSVCLTAIALFQQQLCEQNYAYTKRSVEKRIAYQINNLLSGTSLIHNNTIMLEIAKLNRLSCSPALHYITRQLFLSSPQPNNSYLLERIIAITIIGWMAYTLHDCTIDSVATNKRNSFIIASRILTQLAQNYFIDCSELLYSKDALPITNWIKTTFLEMEQTYYVDISSNKYYRSFALDWDKFLYQRSAGLVIAPVLLCKLHNFKLTINELLSVYKPLIIARQILDDVHDLNDDLDHNRLTFVTSQMYLDKVNAKASITHNQLAAIHAYSMAKINEYLQKARHQLNRLPSEYHEVFIPEIKRLEGIINQQNTAHAVIQTLAPCFQNDEKYQATNLVISSSPPHTTANQPTTTVCSSWVESRSTE